MIIVKASPQELYEYTSVSMAEEKQASTNERRKSRCNDVQD